MSQSDVEMISQREEQTLISTNQLTQTSTQNTVVSSTTLLQQSQPNALLPAQQPAPVQIVPNQPNNAQANPYPQAHPPVSEGVPSTTYQVFLDILFVLYSIYSLCFNEQFSIFLLSWIILYIGNISLRGFKQPIHRAFIVTFSLWKLLVLMYNHFDMNSLSIHTRVFLAIYSVEVLPLICKGCCACFCTCMCATCCICVCIGALVSQACQGYMEKNKYKRARETLCNKDLREITDVQCPICLESGNMMNTQACHHSFHPVCLDNWLKAHKTCPLCRAALY